MEIDPKFLFSSNGRFPTVCETPRCHARSADTLAKMEIDSADKSLQRKTFENSESGSFYFHSFDYISRDRNDDIDVLRGHYCRMPRRFKIQHFPSEYSPNILIFEKRIENRTLQLCVTPQGLFSMLNSKTLAAAYDFLDSIEDNDGEVDLSVEFNNISLK